MKPLLILPALLLAIPAKAQTYADSIRAHRSHYKTEFLADARSPLKADDTAYLRFYAPDARYRVVATFEPTPTAHAFDMATHSGTAKKYRRYGLVTFILEGKKQTLEVYQSLDLIKRKELRDHLFIPFTDWTNYKETYGGGRYLDLHTGDIQHNRVVIDFNKSYNPWCAFGGNYSCPIPPDANKLKVSVKAGEKLFSREVKE